MTLFDKVRLVLFITKMWAYVGLYITKCFDVAFKLILAMPDALLALPAKAPVNTYGQVIKVINAFDKNGNSITNKLKLFMAWYWEKGGPDTAPGSAGFDFNKFSQMINSSILYCSYMLISTKHVSTDNFFKDIHTFFVEQDERGRCFKSHSTDLSDREEMVVDHVDFDHNNGQEKSVQKIVNWIENIAMDKPIAT